MRFTHNPDRFIDRHRSATPKRRALLSLIGGTLVVAGLTLGGCGSSQSAQSAGTLETGKVERAIAQSSLAQRGVHAQVSCPSDVPQEKGFTFTCAATVGQVDTAFVVVERDEFGHVEYEAP
jgi:hypothetical protein